MKNSLLARTMTIGITCVGVRVVRVAACGILSVCLADCLPDGLGSALSAADFKQPAPLEPEVEPASSEAAEVMGGIRIPDGWQIQLFAAEPDVANVVAFDIDNRGRVFVCESFRQNRGVTDNRAHDEKWLLADLSAETVQDRIDYHKGLLGDAAVTYAQHDDRLRRLEDSDGDGIADRSYVFANGFNRIEEGTGAGVLARGQDVYYTCIPKLWKLVDADDNGIADERVVLSDGFGVRVAFRGHDMHGLVLGPDGRLYFSIGDRGYHVTTADGRLLANPESGAVFRCELDGSNLQVIATGLRNPQELAFNDVGDFFTVDNNSDSGDKARVVQILEGGDSGWRMHYQYLPDRGPFNRERIWEPLHSDQPAHIVPPIANLTDGPGGLAYYPGTGFGKQLDDTFLICDFRGGPANSGIRSFKLQPDGAFYQLSDDADPIWTVLATDVAFGPDGAIYISDWVDGWNGLGKGRIYRVTDSQEAQSAIVREVKQLLEGDWSQRPSESLCGDLSHMDRRIRLEAQWELARRGEVDMLLSCAADTNSESRLRLHAVWGADQIARQDVAKSEQVLSSLRSLLADSDPVIRSAAAKVAGERGDMKAVARLREMTADPSPRARYFAAMSLAKLKDAESFTAIVEMLGVADNADPAIRHAGVMALAAAQDARRIATLSAHPSESVRRAAVVALRRLKSGELASFLKDASPRVVAEAARAIYDEPIPVAMTALAEWIDEVTADNELLRRSLNANFRLASADTAARLAAFASRANVRPEMRIEALRILESWAAPDPRDRVLNAFRPIAGRESREAAEALDPQIDSLMIGEPSVREEAIRVASTLGIKKIAPLLVSRISDEQVDTEMRAAALTALARLDPVRSVALARQVKMLPASELLVAALQVLAKHDSQASIGKFIEATQSRNLEVGQLAWDLLAQSNAMEATDAIRQGVAKYLDGTLAPDVHLNVLEAAGGRVEGPMEAALAEHGRALAERDSLAPWLAALEGGDPERGRTLFFENTKLSCLRCHKVDRAGGEVGPVLTVIGKEKDRRYLLESICLPNAQIAKGFETAMILNDSGQTFSGIVKSESDDFVDLIQNDGSQVRIPTDEIEARRKGVSSMPDDLIQQMSRRELRDLVAYLAGLTVDPRILEEGEEGAAEAQTE